MADRVTVKVKGLDGALKKLHGYSEETKQACKDAVRKHTEQMADKARQLAPVDTGNLKTSIETTYSSGGYFGRVRSEARGEHDQFYPFALEFGTYKQPAQPFLSPALESQKAEFVKAIREIPKR